MKNFKKLSRNELKTVNGGKGSSCKLTISINGTTEVHNQYFPGSNSQASSGANAACVDIMNGGSGATRCKYDCAYDGYGN
ncbi:bacteriocin-like protein [Chryseobacterium aahli]